MYKDEWIEKWENQNNESVIKGVNAINYKYNGDWMAGDGWVLSGLRGRFDENGLPMVYLAKSNFSMAAGYFKISVIMTKMLWSKWSSGCPVPLATPLDAKYILWGLLSHDNNATEDFVRVFDPFRSNTKEVLPHRILFGQLIFLLYKGEIAEAARLTSGKLPKEDRTCKGELSVISAMAKGTRDEFRTALLETEKNWLAFSKGLMRGAPYGQAGLVAYAMGMGFQLLAKHVHGWPAETVTEYMPAGMMADDLVPADIPLPFNWK